jgi:3-methylfumaryl-CoA hydratase
MRDFADEQRMIHIAATLDHEQPPWNPKLLSPLGHWLCFRPNALRSRLGHDGHPRRTESGLLPNVDLPRRMWAGSRIRFVRDIALDAAMVRTSTVTAVSPKEGKSGATLFVTVRHEVAGPDGEAAILEEQDIVYRGAYAPNSLDNRPISQVEDAGWLTRTIVPDSVMLFRYSALTFNSHRIHFDGDYARSVEGYPGLVVHGPLLATLLLDHLMCRESSGQIVSFNCRAISPVFAGEAVTLSLIRKDGSAILRAIGPSGPAMTGTVEFAS